jgi:hypothetical protein
MAEAEYQLTRCDEGLQLSAPLWSVTLLTHDFGFSYGLEPSCTIFAGSRRPRDQGGRRNHGVEWVTRRTGFPSEVTLVPPEADGAWLLSHFGHSLPIFVNDVAMPRTLALHTGDVVRPGSGVEFTFSLPADLRVLDALLAREGPSILSRPEPLADHLIETLELEPARARRWITAFIARQRAPR